MKDLARRVSEIRSLKQQLEKNGLKEEMPGMDEVYGAMAEFAMRRKESQANKPLYGLNKVLMLDLTMDERRYSTINLRTLEV